MIVQEDYGTRSDGVKLVRTYSDEGKRIIQNETGVVYNEAVDVENAVYTYSESEEYIDSGMDETAAKAQAYDILTGGAE